MTLTDLLEEFNVVIDTHEGLNELRSLILGLAVRGKLVPQDPKDEPASELFKKIEAEKQRLYEAGEIRKPNKKFKKSIELDFKLPESWEKVNFSEVIQVIRGVSFTKSEISDSKKPNHIPVLRGQNMVDGNLVLDDLIYLNLEKINDIQIAKKNDIVLTLSSGSKDLVGKSALIDVAERFTIGAFYARLLIYYDQTTKYLFNFMQSPLYSEMILSGSRGIGINNLSQKKLDRLSIPLPPLEEQHRIVAKIESLFAEVDELEAQLEAQNKIDEKLQHAVNAEVQQASDAEASRFAWNIITSNFETLFHTPESIDNLKKNILNEAVRGRLVPQDPNDEPASELLKKIEAEKQSLYEAGEIRKPKALPPVTEDEIPFEIPESWEWCRLPEVGILERGKSKHRPRNDPKLFSDGKYPLVQTGDVSQSNVYINTCTNRYNEVGLAQSKLWKKGTLCITIAANIADTGILNFPACFPDSVVGFQVFSESCHIRFYDFFLQVLKENLENMAPSTAQKNINLTILESLAIPFPPGEEQHRIVQRIEELFAICDAYKAQLEQRELVNERLVKGLVQEVLEGV